MQGCMKWSPFLSLALAGALVLSAAADDSVARIAAWNVASGRSNTGGTPIPAERIARLGKVIAEKVKPDVMVLEEVWTADAAKELAAAATKAGFPLEAVVVPAQGEGVVQLVAMIKRPGVEVSDVELIKGSDDLLDGDQAEEKSSRKAVLAKVKIGKFDFYLIGVHLKSKLVVKGVEQTPLQMRDRQLKNIEARIEELIKGPEKDVLMIGDYNMTPKGEEPAGEQDDEQNFKTLNASGQFRFLSTEVKGATHMGYYRGEIHRSKLDGYAISKGAEKEYRKDSFHILDAAALGAKEEQFTDKRSAEFLSDHYPIVAEFETTEDDD
jgi:endonuclease/exonuclease/phosphatase family metal-dependent hydrolase